MKGDATLDSGSESRTSWSLALKDAKKDASKAGVKVVLMAGVPATWEAAMTLLTDAGQAAGVGAAAVVLIGLVLREEDKLKKQVGALVSEPLFTGIRTARLALARQPQSDDDRAVQGNDLQFARGKLSEAWTLADGPVLRGYVDYVQAIVVAALGSPVAVRQHLDGVVSCLEAEFAEDLAPLVKALDASLANIEVRREAILGELQDCERPGMPDWFRRFERDNTPYPEDHLWERRRDEAVWRSERLQVRAELHAAIGELDHQRMAIERERVHAEARAAGGAAGTLLATFRALQTRSGQVSATPA